MKYCTKCGSKLNGGCFCTKCGAAVSAGNARDENYGKKSDSLRNKKTEKNHKININLSMVLHWGAIVLFSVTACLILTAAFTDVVDRVNHIMIAENDIVFVCLYFVLSLWESIAAVIFILNARKIRDRYIVLAASFIICLMFAGFAADLLGKYLPEFVDVWASILIAYRYKAYRTAILSVLIIIAGIKAGSKSVKRRTNDFGSKDRLLKGEYADFSADAGVISEKRKTQKRSLRRWILVLIAIVLIVLLLAGSFFVRNMWKSHQWKEYYDLGSKYLTEESYDEAVIAFTNAIEIDEKQPEAYTGRGDAYVGCAKEAITEEKKEDAVEFYEKAVEDYRIAVQLGDKEAEELAEKTESQIQAVSSEEATDETEIQIPDDIVEFDDHYYGIYQMDSITDYDAAAEYCEEREGYLAVITSQEENDFLYSYMRQSGYESAYFGFSDEDEEGVWKWNNDEQSSYTNWHEGEPSNGGSGYDENYAMFYFKFSDGTWNDGDFGNKTENGGKAFLCEWNENPEEGNSNEKISDERTIALVLDTSGSMSGEPMDETKTASEEFIHTVLEEDASIGIVTYDDSAETISNFSNDKRNLIKLISDVSDGGGGTNIESGLEKASSMLDRSNAEKKIIVLMSDGEPNDGKQGDELIKYAKQIKKNGIYVYTLGFFKDLSDKSSAQALMEAIASDGCHYEVADADDLKFFFGDIADQINGQKYIYIRIACPVDVRVSYDGEILNSDESDQNTRTSFGTLTFEENKNKENGDQIKVLRLKEGFDYDIRIEGIGLGTMNYTIGFMDEDGKYGDLRRFKDVSVSPNTVIDTTASVSDETTLNVDDDGDGVYDQTYIAGVNEDGQAVDYAYIAYIAAGILILVVILIVIVKIIIIIGIIKKRRLLKEKRRS